MSSKDQTEDVDLKSKNKGGLRESAVVIVQALILALVVRTLLFQPFNIPSGSMMDTLLEGDYLFVSKYSYGYSQYSVPFAAIPFSGRIWSAEPERGDVAVFKLPRDNSTDYIKRVVGLPGDRIQMIGGVLHINGEAVKRERIEDFVDEPGRSGKTVRRYIETLPNGVSYHILDLVDGSIQDDTRVFEVPAGQYFMMGDNRDNSTDSRFPSVGPVPFENFVGRAEILFFSVKNGASAWMFWMWPWTVRWDRLLNDL